jgi:hypothetical protein
VDGVVRASLAGSSRSVLSNVHCNVSEKLVFSYRITLSIVDGVVTVSLAG